jgi:sugar phosphate isomerase/epimerase
MALTRRKFVHLAGAAGSAYFLSSLDRVAHAYQPVQHANKYFDLKIMGTNWGFQGSVEAFCKKAKEAGYDGIEMWWPMNEKAQDELFTAIKKYELDIGFLVGGNQANWQEHLAHFKKMLDAAAGNQVQRPLYINCHSGRDFFTFEQNKAFIDYTTLVSKQTGITICHETHRSRMLFAAPVARRFIEKIPELRLTFDVSHWCNVHESFLQDQQETVEMALQRVAHIHARVGHPQGPQVNDPRAPEWEQAVQVHLAWWDAIVQRKRSAGERLTILTEFGPPDYMPTLPYTRQALADQWVINLHMMHLLRKRYLV